MAPMRLCILLACAPQANDRLAAILQPHQVTFVTTFAEALAALEGNTFDLIMIGVYFDESRMFELLSWVRASKSHATAPVICFRGIAAPNGADTFSADMVGLACKAAGANAFFDLVNTADGGGEAQFRQLIDRVLGSVNPAL